MSNQYFDIYEIAERYFAFKRAQLVGLLRQQLTDIFRDSQDQTSFRLVDFGSGDGRLVEDIIRDLPGDIKSRLELVCVEPEASNFAALRETFNGHAGRVNLKQTTMAEFLAQDTVNDGTYDSCLMTHMLYHLAKDDWADAIRPALARLKPRGAALITLVEEDTDAYNLAKKHQAVASGDNDIGGDYVFASDLDAALSRINDISVAKTPNRGSLNTPSEDIDLFINTARQNPDALADLPFVQFLGFILRQPAEKIAGNKPLIDGFIAHFTAKGALETTDTIYRVAPRR